MFFGELYLTAYQTLHFGAIQFIPDQVITFPDGLPAFEQERQFLPIEQPSSAPLIFLQSLSRPDLVFITLPAALVDPAYRLMAAAEDLELLGLPPDRQPDIGEDVLCLAILTVAEGKTPTANLMAPILVNRKTRLALQAIQVDSAYSHQHVLPARSPARSMEDRCS